MTTVSYSNNKSNICNHCIVFWQQLQQMVVISSLVYHKNSHLNLQDRIRQAASTLVHRMLTNTVMMLGNICDDQSGPIHSSYEINARKHRNHELMHMIN